MTGTDVCAQTANGSAERRQAANAGGLSTLLLLADGRFPSGGHAHSGGLEPAVAAGRVTDVASLGEFLIGRANTAGFVAATFAAAACTRAAAQPSADGAGGDLTGLDLEYDARTPAPALRRASRTLGRQLLRAARTMTGDPRLDALGSAVPAGPHQPIVLGTAACALDLSPAAVAAASLHEATTGPATAAIRLLGLDPLAVHAMLARLSGQLDTLAAQAARHAVQEPSRLPSPSAMMLDISGQAHATWEVRLFAS